MPAMPAPLGHGRTTAQRLCRKRQQRRRKHRAAATLQQPRRQHPKHQRKPWLRQPNLHLRWDRFPSVWWLLLPAAPRRLPPCRSLQLCRHRWPHHLPQQYRQPAPAPAAATAASIETEKPFVLPVASMEQVAQSSGLQWVHTDTDKVAAVQAAIDAEPAPLHVPRERAPVVAMDDGPLVLVETRRDLGSMELPFDQQQPSQQPPAV